MNGDIFTLKLPDREELKTDKYQFNTLINTTKPKNKPNKSIPLIVINPIFDDDRKFTINSGGYGDSSLFKQINIGYIE